MSEANCDIGLIGLAVMGQNLVLNMNDHGYKVAVFNRTVSKVDDFLENEAQGTQVAGAHSIQEMCAMLKKPRRVMIMVKAGEVVDQTIDQVLPHLEKGDILIDGGNSCTPTRPVELRIWPPRAFCLSGRAFPEAKRVHASDLPSCRAETRKRGPT